MFLIEVAPDELSYLKRVLDAAPVKGTEAVMHAEIRKRTDQPIIGEKLVADIQQKAMQQQGGAQPAPTQMPPVPQGAPEVPRHAPMPGPDAIPAYPMPNMPPQQ